MRYEEIGEEAEGLGLNKEKELKQEYFMGPSGLLPVIYGKPLPVCPATERQRRMYEEEVAGLEREGTLSQEEDDNDCPAGLDAEGDTEVGSPPINPRIPIIPATPGGPRDPIYVPSSPPERDTTMGEAGRRAEGLGASKHAPVTESQEAEEEEGKETEAEEDTEMD